MSATSSTARGSDLGAGVLQQLALNHPDRLIALHLSGTNPYLGWIPDDLSPAEQQFVTDAQQWNQTEMAYALERSSKPQTLANALNDSPAGLAAWILEKFHRWSDCDGDLDSVYDRADLLTNLTIYWATRTIGSSMRLYYETAHSTTAGYGRVEIPTGIVQRRHIPHSTRMGRTAVQTSPTGPTSPRRPFPGMGRSPAHRRRSTLLLQLPPINTRSIDV